MQRGVGNVNPMKMAKCIKELERIYGIRQSRYGGNGSNQYKVLESSSFTPAKTQKELAKQIGISRMQLINYKKLQDLIPELQSLIDNGSMKASMGYEIWARMPKEEQEKFFNEIGRDKIKKLTRKATQELIDEKRALESKNNILNNDLQNKIQEQNTLKTQIQSLKEELNNRPVVEVEKNIIPNDYEYIKKELKNKDDYFNNLKRDYDDKVKKMQSLEDEITSLKNVSEAELYSKRLKDNALMFCTKVENFFESVAGLAWLSEHINELPKYERDSYIKAVQLVEDWATAVKMNMGKYI